MAIFKISVSGTSKSFLQSGAQTGITKNGSKENSCPPLFEPPGSLHFEKPSRNHQRGEPPGPGGEEVKKGEGFTREGCTRGEEDYREGGGYRDAEGVRGGYRDAEGSFRGTGRGASEEGGLQWE